MLVLDQVKRGDPRLRYLAAGFFLGFAVLLVGLWYVQIVSQRKYAESQKIQSFRTVRVPAARGRILDRNGQVLADNQPRFNINLFLEDIRPQFIYEYTNAVRKEFVAAHHRKPKKDELFELEKLARYRVVSNIVWKVSSAVLPQPLALNPFVFEKSYTEKRAIPMSIVTDLTAQQIALFTEKNSDLPGIELEVEPYRFYPYGSLAAHVLGYVQREQHEEKSEDNEISFHYRLPDYQGVTGLEGGFDEDLRGHAGAKAILVNNIGYRQSEETWVESSPGKSVVLTLDLDIQKAAERALLMSGPDTRGAAVVLNCKTGDILAMASAPSYDLNMFVRPRDFGTNDWDRLRDDVLTPQYNRALQGAYHPGSTFKILVALTCFENGIMGPEDTMTHPGYYKLGKRPIHDLAPAGTYNFKEAFKHSCNSYFIDFGLKAGVEKLEEMGQRFNLGQKTGVVQPALEQAGYFPSIGQKVTKDGERWTDWHSAILCIGQGEIMVTPLQMALMVGAVANGGKLLKPRLAVQLEDPISKTGLESMPPAQVEREINVSPRSLELVRQAMRADVEEEGGTGKLAFIPGMGICGKTGTAQIKKNGRIDHVTWFVSFAPFDNPKYAVVIMVESGSSGGGTCAPKAKEIYKTIQRLDLDRLKHMAGE
ncbi:MAG TPA: penicillin-binding protein 2 [Verrucomicrobiae bacterium]|jgi:penicillin-binding protein 2|nr:penicillin-binding protein 2 [Verrucomicrobiae bacterium]